MFRRFDGLTGTVAGHAAWHAVTEGRAAELDAWVGQGRVGSGRDAPAQATTLDRLRP